MFDKYIDRMIDEKVITAEQKEEYLYGLQNALLKMLNMIMCAIVICFMPYKVCSSLFLFFLFWLRGNTGGYHATSPYRCLLCGCTVLSVSSYVAIFIYNGCQCMTWLLVVISSVVIMVWAPVNDKNINLTEYEIKICKRGIKRVLFLEILFITAMGVNNSTRLLASYGSLAIIVCAIAVLGGRWQNNGEKENR